jgi:hypothetical protein
MEVETRSVALAGQPSANGFMMCPLPLNPSSADRSWQQQVYQMAFEQAQAVVRPSWIERDVLGVWN